MSLDIEDRKTVGKDLLKIEEGYPIGMPVCRSLGEGLLECRSNIKHGIARVIFCLSGTQMIALNGSIKKTQQTPRQEIELALKRKWEMGL
ncbi:MAG: type II toxin-antitoxin system RelE/ParE family toxin [Chloroflexota bacterium]|nr:type II toxin-antitoxin system RelE/ParE family toxin [Chloroflexota bacterium]